jgi:hypothetical protein
VRVVQKAVARALSGEWEVALPDQLEQRIGFGVARLQSVRSPVY